MRTRTFGSTRGPVAVALALAFLFAGWPAVAGPVASGPEATADDREITGDILAREAVAEALAAQGLAPEDIEDRLERLSDEDIRYFADHEDQIRSAGVEIEEKYIWIGVAVLIVLLLI